MFDDKKKTAKRHVGAENQKSEPLKLEISCGPTKQNEKGIQKSMIILNIICMHG